MTTPLFDERLLVVSNTQSSSTGSPHNFQVRFDPEVQTPPGTTVAVKAFSAVQSWWNISSTRGNNTYRRTSNKGVSWSTETLPDGLYSVSALSAAIGEHFRLAGWLVGSLSPVTLETNQATGRVVCVISDPSDYGVDFSNDGESSLYTTLGFTYLAGSDLQEGRTTASNDANLEASISQFCLCLDKLRQGASWLGGSSKGQTALTFSFTTLPQYTERFEPYSPTFLACDGAPSWADLTVSIRDQNGVLIPFTGDVSVTLVLRTPRRLVSQQ